MITSLFMLMPVSLVMGGFALFLFIKAIKGGWFEDVEGPKYRMLDDDPDEEPEIPQQQRQQIKQDRRKQKHNRKNSNNEPKHTDHGSN